MGWLSPRSRWALLAALPFLSIGAGLLLLLVDLVLAAVVTGFGLFVLTPLLGILFSFWPRESSDERASAPTGAAVDTGVGGSETTNEDGSAGRDDVAEIRDRYVDGELTEAEFERRLEEVLDGDGAAARREAGSIGDQDREGGSSADPGRDGRSRTDPEREAE